MAVAVISIGFIQAGMKNPLGRELPKNPSSLGATLRYLGIAPQSSEGQPGKASLYFLNADLILRQQFGQLSHTNISDSTPALAFACGIK